MKPAYVQKQVLTALLDLLRKEDLEKITVSQICEKAQVGRTSFYRYYQSPDHVLLLQAQDLIQGWGQEIEGSPHPRPDQIITSLFQHIKDHQDFYQMLYRNQMTSGILDSFKSHLGLIPNLDNHTAYGRAFFAHALFGWIDEWILRGMNEDPQELGNLFWQETQIIFQTLQVLSQTKDISDLPG